MSGDKCEVQKTIDALIQARQPEEDRYLELADYVAPHRYRKYLESAKHEKRSRPEIVNERATLDLRTMTSGMMAGVTSPSRPWFRLGIADTELAKFAPVRDWLYEVQDRMRSQLNRSNFYKVMPSVYTDMGLFAIAACAQLEDDEDVFRFYTFPVCSYAIASNHRRKIDTFTYQTRMTVGTVVNAYGIENVCKQTKQAYEKGDVHQDVDVDILIQPNRDYKEDSPLMIHAKYKAWFKERNGKKGKYLLESGFSEFPVFIPRWETVDNDAYPRNCPAMDALGSIRALQLEERTKLKAIEKQADPPLAVPTSMKGKIRRGSGLLPADVIYEDMPTGMQGVRSVYDVRFDVSGVMEDIYKLEGRIREAFFADLFLMLSTSDRRQITAREVQEKHEEKLMVLGPALESIHEVLDEVIDRTFSIMMRRGLLPEPPPELEGMELKVEYISILAQAMRMIGNASIDQYMDAVGRAAQLDPQALDKFDADATLDHYAEALGVPPKVNRSQEDTDALRQQRAQQQAAMQQAEQAAQMVDSAKTLSETDTSGQNGLTDLAERMAGGAL